jgi:hypothetical protein
MDDAIGMKIDKAVYELTENPTSLCFRELISL